MATTLNLIITDAGIQEVINAQHDGTAPVVLSQVGVGRGIYTPVPSQTAMHDEIKRLGSISGGVVGGNIMHIQALDGDAASAYAVYEVGVYTASGTLFAVYSQALPILHKVANSEIMLAIDIILTGVEPTAVTVGDTNYTLAPATTSNLGVVELATTEEAVAGTDTERAVTPAGAAAAIAAGVTPMRNLFVTTHAEGSPSTGDAQDIYGVKTFKNAVQFSASGNSILYNNGMIISSGGGQIYFNANGNLMITPSSGNKVEFNLPYQSGNISFGQTANFGSVPIEGLLKSLYSNGVGGLFTLTVVLNNGVDGDGFNRGDTIYTGKSVGTGTITVYRATVDIANAAPASMKFAPLMTVKFYQAGSGYTVEVLAVMTAQ